MLHWIMNITGSSTLVKRRSTFLPSLASDLVAASSMGCLTKESGLLYVTTLQVSDLGTDVGQLRKNSGEGNLNSERGALAKWHRLALGVVSYGHKHIQGQLERLVLLVYSGRALDMSWSAGDFGGLIPIRHEYICQLPQAFLLQNSVWVASTTTGGKPEPPLMENLFGVDLYSIQLHWPPAVGARLLKESTRVLPTPGNAEPHTTYRLIAKGQDSSRLWAHRGSLAPSKINFTQAKLRALSSKTHSKCLEALKGIDWYEPELQWL